MNFRAVWIALGVTAAVVLVGTLLLESRPRAQEVEEPETSEVTERELDLFIDVYSSMQADHDLTIDEVLSQREVSLQEFRDIERRIQQQGRLVRRVREALIDHAKAHAESVSVPTVPAQDEEPAVH